MHVLPILLVVLGFLISMFWPFHVSVSLVLNWPSFSFEFNVIAKDLITFHSLILFSLYSNNLLKYKNRVIKKMLPERFVCKEKCNL